MGVPGLFYSSQTSLMYSNMVLILKLVPHYKIAADPLGDFVGTVYCGLHSVDGKMTCTVHTQYKWVYRSLVRASDPDQSSHYVKII